MTDTSDQAEHDRAATEAQARKARLHDDLVELLDLQSGAGRRVLRWITYEPTMAGAMSSPWSGDPAARDYMIGRQSLGYDIITELEQARMDASFAVLLEGTGLQRTKT